MIEQGKSDCFSHSMGADDLAVIMYTSGTTGISEGVMLSNRNLLSNSDCFRHIVDTNMDQTLLVPLNHIFAIFANLNALTADRDIHIYLNLRYMLKDFQAAKSELLFVVPMLVKNMYALLWLEIQQPARMQERQCIF